MKVLILNLLLLVTTISSATADTEIVLSTIQRLPISTNQQTGLADRIAIEAFRRIGIKAIIKKIPARRALRDANEGIHDGDLARIAGVTSSHPNLLPIPEITWIAEIVAFSKDKRIKTPNWDSLKHYQTTYIRGWVVFDKNVPDTQKNDKVVTPEALFKMLKMDRSELALYEKKMGYGLIQEQQLTGMHALKPALTIEPIYIYLHKKHADLLPKVAAAIRDMKQDGSYEVILRQSLKKALTPQALQAYINLQQLYDVSLTQLELKPQQTK